MVVSEVEPYRDSVISISFDDGYECIYRHAYPFLSEVGIRGTVFVIVDYIGKENLWDVPLSGKRDRHLNRCQILEMVDHGWEIGSHTLSHRCLTILKTDELKKEIGDSKKYLEDILGVEVKVLSAPFGRVNYRVVEIAHEAGYKAVCGFYPFRLFYGRRFKGEIPRLAVYSIDRVSDILGKLSSNRRELFYQMLKQNMINFCANGTILTKSLK